MSATISSAVEEQNSTTNEIARTVSTVSVDANIVLDSVGGLTHSSATSSAKSIRVTWEAADLDKSIEAFNYEIQAFLKSVNSD
ncbi:MAG: hypothetical protein HOF84_09295 [Rhodospirillales bacterium]|nr:hypothetical protein [Rhodospirillales bacterium]